MSVTRFSALLAFLLLPVSATTLAQVPPAPRGIELNAGFVAMQAQSANQFQYQFGTRDFSVTAVFRTKSPGTVVSRKGANGGHGNGGWLVVVQPLGALKFTTDSGFGLSEVVSGATLALDGAAHSLAAIRRDGRLFLFLDGRELPTTAKGARDVMDVNSYEPLRVGSVGQVQERYRQFTGAIRNVTLWNRAIEPPLMTAAAKGELTPDVPGLVGFWRFDGTYTDESHAHNHGAPRDYGTPRGTFTWVPM